MIRKSLPLLLLVAFCLIGSPAAWAIQSPGLTFEQDFQPDPIQFPTSYQDSFKAVYEARQAVERALVALDKENETYKIKLDSLEKQGSRTKSQVKRLKDKHEKAVEKAKADLVELQKAYFFLSSEELKKGSDPYFLYHTAYLLFPKRGNPPEMAQQKVGSRAFFSPEDLKEFKKDAGLKSKAQTSDLAPGSPVATKLYTSNYQKMLDCLEEINQRFSNFEDMEKVIRFLAFIKGEAGQTLDALTLYKRYLTYYAESEHVADILWEVAELRFSHRTGYDSMNKAVALYKEALKHVKDANDIKAFRIRYKIAWAQYLSSDLKEDALNSFKKLYYDLKQAKLGTREAKVMETEAVQIVKQIKALESSNYNSSFE